MRDLSSITKRLVPCQPSGSYFGVVVGIVTNNQDPDGLGRVKLRLPWLSDEEETHWARVVTPMAGPERGMYFLPEVEDEVLVAFEHGATDVPYVLGSLWNGQDAPPESNDDGANNMRSIRSRSGHVIRLNDTDGEEKIEIIDKTENNSIVIDTSSNAIAITGEGDITLESTDGNVIITGKSIEISSTDADVVIDASGNADVTGGSDVNINGSTVNIN